jgi:hypothetical protein
MKLRYDAPESDDYYQNGKRSEGSVFYQNEKTGK